MIFHIFMSLLCLSPNWCVIIEQFSSLWRNDNCQTSAGIGLNKNYYNRPKAIWNWGSMPPIYMWMLEKKYKVICVELYRNVYGNMRDEFSFCWKSFLLDYRKQWCDSRRSFLKMTQQIVGVAYLWEHLDSPT